MLTFSQYAQMDAAMRQAVSTIPTVANGMVRPSARNTDALYFDAVHGLGSGHVREVHVDELQGQRWTFDWVFATPLKRPTT